ncbi:putative Phosphopantothenoylcysteine decarboxylase [Podospora australis]|uniref:Phosphopantothenoylcysteine decarboxylase n=1 Tax=Podospora australis TaxID=1536484 RepID=A0AAN6WNR8_9PEZI|nr:putative Phosphopantothenoylcysteine decarboxylase [Podospora australis]
MLQAASNTHDDHYLGEMSTSAQSLIGAIDDGKKHLLLAASGSVATIKIPVIVEALSRHTENLAIRIVFTKSATAFLNGQSNEQPTVSSLLHLPNVEAVYLDEDEWGHHPWRRGASILHIELRRWADLLVIAPLSANTLAKLANGMSDNLLTSIVRAWDTEGTIDLKKKYIAVAPAMNSAMWRHPITAKQIKTLSEDWGVKEGTSTEDVAGGWFQVIPPISKTLACGDTGDGAMASVQTICEVIEHRLGLNRAD